MNDKEIAEFDEKARQIGIRLKTLREDRHITKVDIAQMAGLSRSAVLKIEKGERIPTISTLMRLTASLGVNLWEVLREIEE